MNENETVKKETIIRTIVLVITLFNSVITMCGINPLPFSDEEIYKGVSSTVSVVVSLWTWWKNNSFTKKAIKADEYKKNL